MKRPILFLLFYCWGTSLTAVSLTRQVKYWLYQEKDYHRAISLTQRWREREPKNMLPHYLEACAYYQLKEYSKASARIRAAAFLNPKNISVRIEAGKIYNAAGEFATARRHLFAALRQTVKNHRVFFQLGRSFFLERHLNKAIYLFGKTLYLAPDHDPSHFYLAQSYFYQKKFDLALIAVNSAMSGNPRKPDYQVLKADIYLAMQDRPAALRVLQKAKKQFPQHKLIREKLTALHPSS